MQNGARMWLERHHGGLGAGSAGAFDYRLYDQLVAKVQAIKNA